MQTFNSFNDLANAQSHGVISFSGQMCFNSEFPENSREFYKLQDQYLKEYRDIRFKMGCIMSNEEPTPQDWQQYHTLADKRDELSNILSRMDSQEENMIRKIMANPMLPGGFTAAMTDV